MTEIPEHLLKRARAARAAAKGEPSDDDQPSDAPPRPTHAGRPASDRPPTTTPVGAGPGDHTQRLLTVVKSGSIQEIKSTPVDKVHTWPHLLAIEFVAALSCLTLLLLFSIFVNAPCSNTQTPTRHPTRPRPPGTSSVSKNCSA